MKLISFKKKNKLCHWIYFCICFKQELKYINHFIHCCVLGRIMSPKCNQVLVPGTYKFVTLNGKEDFADVI